MKVKKAIKIIEEQRQKVLNPKHPNNNEWIVETASYIRDFFGFDSTEYFRFAKFKWQVKTLNTESEGSVLQRLEENKAEILQFLENCKRTLRNKGLYRETKKNLLSDKSNSQLIGIIFGICVSVFGLGYWAKEFEVFSVMSRSEKSTSIQTIKTPENGVDKKEEPTKSVNK
jgi:hypothetical protein